MHVTFFSPTERRDFLRVRVCGSFFFFATMQGFCTLYTVGRVGTIVQSMHYAHLLAMPQATEVPFK